MLTFKASSYDENTPFEDGRLPIYQIEGTDKIIAKYENNLITIQQYTKKGRFRDIEKEYTAVPNQKHYFVRNLTKVVINGHWSGYNFEGQIITECFEDVPGLLGITTRQFKTNDPINISIGFLVLGGNKKTKRGNKKRRNKTAKRRRRV